MAASTNDEARYAQRAPAAKALPDVNDEKSMKIRTFLLLRALLSVPSYAFNSSGVEISSIAKKKNVCCSRCSHCAALLRRLGKDVDGRREGG